MRKQLMWAVLLLFVMPTMASAYWGEDRRHRNDLELELQRGEYRDGWDWSRGVEEGARGERWDYCWRVMVWHQKKAENLNPGWYKTWISGIAIVGEQRVRKVRKADRLKGQNPCLKFGVVPGRQPKAGARSVSNRSREVFEVQSIELPLPSIGCPGCYRVQGALCDRVFDAELDVRLAQDADDHVGDHGIKRAAQLCRDQLQTEERN